MAENVASKFNGLPMKDLIGAPLKAACDAQVDLAGAAGDYMMQVGFADPDKGDARLVKFNLSAALTRLQRGSCEPPSAF